MRSMTLSRTCLALFGLCFAAVALEPQDAKGSHDHPAVKRYPGSYIKGRMVDYRFATFPLPDPSSKNHFNPVAGRLFSVMHVFPKEASCTQVLHNYENAFQEAGLTARRAEGGVDLVAIGAGGFGSKYVVGEGKLKDQPVAILQTCSEGAGHSGYLVVVEVKPMEQVVTLRPEGGATSPADPRDAKGAKDHPRIPRYPGTWIAPIAQSWETKEFEEYKFQGAPGTPPKTVEGKYFKAVYALPQNVSCEQFLLNYESAFRNAGMETFVEKELAKRRIWQPWISAEGKMGGAGPTTWVHLDCIADPGKHQGLMTVVEAAAMEQKVEVTAAFLGDEMAKSGHVAVYGIHFATGKAEITPDSTQVLREIGKLLAAKPDWKLRIEGHTDNVGEAASNFDLSKRRAASLKDWLVKSAKVDPARLTTEGFGDSKPIAPNDTEEGRAKNRRVELVKLGSASVPAPETYSMTEIDSRFVAGMTVKIYRDGTKLFIDRSYVPRGSSKLHHVQTLYELQAQRSYTWDPGDTSIPCGPSTFSGDWGDPFSGEMTADLAQQHPTVLGHETINGIETKVLQVVVPGEGKAKLWINEKYGLIVKWTIVAENGQARTMLEIKEFSLAKPPDSLFVLPANCAKAPAETMPTESQRIERETGGSPEDFVDGVTNPPSDDSCTALLRMVRAGTMQPITTGFQIAIDTNVDTEHPPKYVMALGAGGRMTFSGGGLHEVTGQMRNGVLRIDNVPRQFDIEAHFDKGGEASALIYRQCFRPETVLLIAVKNAEHLSAGVDWLWVKSGKFATVSTPEPQEGVR